MNIFFFSPLLLILHCNFIFFFKKWLGPVGTFYASISVFLIAIIINFNELYYIVLNGNYFFIDFGRWFFCLDLIDSHLVFCIDPLSLILANLVLILTSLALVFGVEYMYREAFINRLLYLLNLFATSVILLFFCYDFFLIIFCWECIGLFSLLLVNFYSIRIYTIKAALKTFVFSRLSDLSLFLSFLFAISIFNTTDLSLIFVQIPYLYFHILFINKTAIHFLSLFAFLVSTAGIVKGAQFFFHVWLPDAMEAPTPASALIHSSTLVIAGIFIILRFSILFEFTILVNYYLSLYGAITLVFGSITATFQNDIKKLVAYSTISQIGYLVCGCGYCCYEEVLLYLILHALNKAFLFILVGYIVHFFNNNTDLRQMGGMYLYSFDICILLFGVCANLTGLPYAAGFIGKEFLLFQFFTNDLFSFFIKSCWIISFFFTPIYMFLLIFCVMFGPKKSTKYTYFSIFYINFSKYSKILINTANKNYINTKFNNSINFFFQWTIITSRSTIYILFFFWIFFFFFGESLLLILFNFSSIIDTVPSFFFFSLKTHFIFSLKLPSILFFFNFNFILYLLLFLAFFYLFSLFFKINYNYFYQWFILDFFIFLFLFFFFI